MATSFRKFLEGLRIIPKVSSSSSETGDLEVLSSDGKLRLYNASQSGIENSPVVTEAHSAVLTNKTIDGDNNTVQDLALTSLKTVLGDANEVIRRDAAGAIVSGNTLPNSSELVTVDSSTALTNKTLTSPVLNTPTADTITNIAGGPLTLQSTINQNVVFQASGTGQIQLNSNTSAVSRLSLNILTDAATTGSNATVATVTKSYIQLTNASLTSIDGVSAGSNGQLLILSNRTGVSVVINNETGATAANRILTGTNGAISLENNASLNLVYNSLAARWMIIGGVGGNLVVNLTAGESLLPGEAVYVSQGAADGGRTAGRVYKLDATNSNRVEFIGFVLDAASSGSVARVQVAGGLTGFSGLSTGLPVYASVTVPGSTQNSAPTTGGQWFIQLGIATSASSIVINGAGGATAVQLDLSSGAYLNRRSVSASTSLTNNDDVIIANAAGGAVDVTLPAPSDGKLFYIKKIDSSRNIVSLLPSPGVTIDGESQASLIAQYDSIEVISDGTNWFII